MRPLTNLFSKMAAWLNIALYFCIVFPGLSQTRMCYLIHYNSYQGRQARNSQRQNLHICINGGVPRPIKQKHCTAQMFVNPKIIAQSQDVSDLSPTHHDFSWRSLKARDCRRRLNKHLATLRRESPQGH